jgi:hypothetical protein
MRVRTLPSTSIAVALAVTIGSVTMFGQSPTPAAVKPVAVVESSKSVPASQPFATLAGVKAVPMASGELAKVKGLHIHFTTPGNNTTSPFGASPQGWHFVNHTENNLGNGQAPAGAGPGYSGLCGAALNSPALTIPGQNPVTGIGGGC